MTDPTQSIQDALQTFDHHEVKAHLEAGQKERTQFLERFPLEHWPAMTLEQYALGQADSAETYCRWLEFATSHLGSISGGSSVKHIIYKHKNKPGWHFPSKYGDEQEAWQAVHEAFLEAFSLAQNGDWLEIDALEALQGGRALRVKSLHLYFSDEIMPVYSREHMLYFLKRLDVFKPEMKNWEVVQLNRTLLATLKNIPELQGWTTNQMERLLYYWADPRETRRVVKIAPGRQAVFWPDCLANGYICVGWDAVGDLHDFDAQEDFSERFYQEFADNYNNHTATTTKKGKELWSLIELEPGDLIIANQGTSKVLAVGEVQEPGYEWRPDRVEYKHTVRVKWDTSYEQEITPQKKWGLVTVSPIAVELYQQILTHKQNGGRPGAAPAVPVPIPSFYLEIAEALERKGQAILYGPPGTGKTYQARQFAIWWLLQQQQESAAQAILANPELRVSWEKRLTSAPISRRVWWIVANPTQWNWEQLFAKDKETYKYGRLRRNYPLVQPGDLVIGYQAAPDKRIVALARVTKGLNEMADEGAGLEIEPVCRLNHGLSYAELQSDPILKNSEPMRHSCQGTLFALTSDEVERLLAVLSERGENLDEYLSLDEGVNPLTWTTFHPSYSYEDFIEGFRPVPGSGEGLVLKLEDGLFKRICREARAHPKRRYLLVVDEINRANLAKVFGELITLLEKDKRGLIITLPQSKESFTIPPNVYLLGTMNTADRSIKLLDVALRRRFAFLEVMPDLGLLEATVNELHLGEFLKILNRRIASTEGREKQIGHAVLLEEGQPVTEPAEFARRFRHEILPLLQEYCYDDYATLATYLGESLVDTETRSLKVETINDADKLIEALTELVKSGDL